MRAAGQPATAFLTDDAREGLPAGAGGDGVALQRDRAGPGQQHRLYRGSDTGPTRTLLSAAVTLHAGAHSR